MSEVFPIIIVFSDNPAFLEQVQVITILWALLLSRERAERMFIVFMAEISIVNHTKRHGELN